MSRGMKKYLPFASLREQAVYLNKMTAQKKKVEKPLISEDIQAEINLALTHYAGETVEIHYYDDGYIKSITTEIKKIDIHNRKLILAEFSITFTNLLNIITT